MDAAQTRNVDPDSPTVPMPAKLDPILQRLQEVLNGWNPDQLTVNDYAPGVGLSPHIDTHSAFTGASNGPIMHLNSSTLSGLQEVCLWGL